MYEIRLSKTFVRLFEKLVKRDVLLRKRIDSAMEKMRSDPFQSSLKTHRVGTRNYGERWSSYVTGDLRIIWDFDEGKTLAVFLITLGGHSGGRDVYK